VTDLASEGLRLLSARSPLAIPILFGAGVVTSIGPCVAPRYVALTAIAQRSGRPWQTAAIFAVGVVSAYVALGMATGLLSAVRGWSTAIDAGLACALAGAGCITLLRDDAHGHAHPASRTTTAGGTYLVGACSALVASPCCTPLVAGIGMLSALDGRPLETTLLIAAFAGGHALPLAAAVGVGRWPRPARIGSASASRAIAGTLMIALGAFYGLLA
jgi:thiol:disulfide interchange protein DsbD